ncbi:uncharacterized protein LOC124362228 [Homalodisca vitripennis]|uniref:uncharacterized protein LOC124362228 n=1 Tax=Homalodisca vitripennis TaxID=197043 RepID=UPI001EECB004|nr:uncharacterized protein LOC124362228 [Homalodisca vitripennis]
MGENYGLKSEQALMTAQENISRTDGYTLIPRVPDCTLNLSFPNGPTREGSESWAVIGRQYTLGTALQKEPRPIVALPAGLMEESDPLSSCTNDQESRVRPTLDTGDVGSRPIAISGCIKSGKQIMQSEQALRQILFKRCSSLPRQPRTSG